MRCCVGIALSLLLRRVVAVRPPPAGLRAPIALADLGRVQLGDAVSFAPLARARHDAATILPTLLVLLAFGRLATVALFDWMLSRRFAKRDGSRASCATSARV